MATGRPHGRPRAFGLGFLEAPTIPEDPLGQAKTERALDVAVAGGAERCTRFEFRDRFVQGSFDIAQPDDGRVGITEAKEVAMMAEVFGVPTVLHLGVGLGVYMAASIQLAAAPSDFQTIEYQPTQLEFANHLLDTPIRNAEGAYDIPEGPGLGVAFAEDALLQHCTNVAVVG